MAAPAPRPEPAPAWRRGSRGYDPNHKQDALTAKAANVKLTPSESSLSLWSYNGVSRKRQRGNQPSFNMRGEHTFLLVLCRELHPKATADEVCTFIAAHATNPVVYTRQDVSKREEELGYKRKKGSTTAYQAYTPLNKLRRHMFWTTAYPTGVIGTPRQRLIDIDEAGLWIEKANRKFGKALPGVRVREPGPYGHSEKWTIILAIDCQGKKWVYFEKVAGTSIERFNNFIQTIINSFPVGHPQRTFMWDNLNAHLSATVYNTVTFAGHRVLNRPPYMPKDGPIEYVFNHLQNELNRRIQSISDDVSFRTQVHNIITQLGPGFDATFVHCGYA